MELDDAYANAPYIENGDAFPGRWAADAAAFREGMMEQGLAELDISYGDSPRQAFDLFRPEGEAKGLLIFVHGGYWIKFDKSMWSHLAAGALEKGWAVAMPSYDLCPDVRIADISRQIAKMIPQAAAMVAGPILLAGHSAGGHLVARMATPGMLPPGVAVRVARIMPISPVADLRPMVKTSMNAEFKMEMADAAMESPTLMLPMPGMDVVVWVGAEERPAFLEQATALAEAWRCECIVAPGRHHLDVIDELADPDSRMIARLLPE
ncbi:MAG: alpha/beta hydrolase [Thalassovita sp.]|nr:alpha/beta hydrolase [Thalassovita sp.]